MGLTSIGSDNIWGKIDVQSGKLKETTTYSTIGFVNLSKRSSATTKVSISSGTSDVTGDKNGVQEKIPHVLEVTDQDLGMIYSNFDLFVAQWIKSQLNSDSVAVGIGDAYDFSTIGKICAIVSDQDGGERLYCREGKITQCVVGDHGDNQHSDIDIVGDVMEGIGCVADTIVILDDGKNNASNLHDYMLRLIAGIKRRRGSIEPKWKFGGKIHVVAFVISSDRGESFSHAFSNMKKEMNFLQSRLGSDDGKGMDFEFVVDIIPVSSELLLTTTPVYRDWNIVTQSQNNTIPLLDFDRFIRGIITKLSGSNNNAINITFDSLLLGLTENHGNGDNCVGIDSQNEDVNNLSDLDNDHPGEALNKKLIKLSNELKLSAEKSISWLESKQDEILSDPDTKMPILEFGSGMISFSLVYFLTQLW